MKKVNFLILLFSISFILIAQEDSFFFEDDFNMDEEETSLIMVNSGGLAGFNTQYIDGEWRGAAYLDIDITGESSSFDIIGNFDVKLENFNDFCDFPLQNSPYRAFTFIDTLYIRYYNSMFDLEVGLLKPIWGNADGIHAVDLLNPLDYSDPFGTSYLDSKISQQMVKVNVPIGVNSLLEVSYLPSFQGDNIPLSGTWTPAYIKNMEETIYLMAYPSILEQVTASLPNNTPQSIIESSADQQSKNAASTIVSTINFDEAEYFIDSQVAARFTTSLNYMDLGFTYYYGFLKQPTLDPADVLENLRLNLIYNRVQTIGFDIAAQIGSFNTKGELAYNLTNDLDGSDPAVNNNSVKYILGFDINLPINNMNILLQGVGDVILSSSNIGVLDPQYSTSDEYWTLSIMGRVSDSYLNEKLSLEITGSYSIVDRDFMAKPKATYSINDNSKIYAQYLLLEGGATTTFGQYDNNDTLTIGLDFIF
ncbi:hypothetical protein EW093_06900 [Thiospirochaeta perfilievii]|uniref:Porin n=1 Tax=Thiospirochaeta perfilievii TaxID=252967 RepID=A0A5C1QCN7_9SPIO|nr:hypothetical protein [Thiospirochaeta perfilievii]QEN04436.1 hypothetical protein EW093_06900 [Thiospirochaeta perfilievii]